MDRRSEASPWSKRELALLSRDELSALVRERSDALETVMDTMVDLLLTLDATGEIELANRAVGSTLGYDPDEVVGKPIDSLLASSEAAAERELLTGGEFVALLVRDGQVPDVEVAFSAVDGELLPMSLSTSAIERDDGGIDGFVCVGKDISDRIERERTLTRRTEQLELLNQLIRHDIGNDVNLVLELVRQLRREEPAEDEPFVLDRRQRQYLEQIEESGRRMAALTERAHNLTQAFAELGEDCEPIPIEPVLRREVANASTLSHAATVEVDGDIPDVTVRANEMVTSLFRNLLSNAIKHNDDPQPTVRVGTTVTDTTVTVQLTDNGPGLPEPLKTSLGTGEHTTAPSGSSGFGLYIVETLVEQYGGRLDVSDADPVGTTFRVTLKRA